MGGEREGATETILVAEVLLPGTWLPGAHSGTFFGGGTSKSFLQI